MSRPPFRKVLIANRGEIACRIAAVLRARGIASVAVYSEADAGAPHRHAADEAVLIGPPPVAKSYLDQDAILEAARRTGAEAIHPGYGLLSENTGFARRIVEAGVVFIGPTPEAIDAMGDKAAARRTAKAAGVPVVPGSDGPVDDDAEAERIAEQIGYPVLVKAAGGGGGIGMAQVPKPDKLARALESCRDRGRSSFGNPAVYLEKYIERPRHIEVQVLFDHHGHGVHLFERECTLQRRHQKVIEEAPSPFVTAHPDIREGLTAAALKAASAIGYRNAGTVEFVVGQDGSFYFIEMNTRLQVEHPVTEAITGVDLIGWQLDIAAGAPLTLRQEDLRISGAAVECRMYAEDPAKGFIPRPGRIGRFVPPSGPGIRVDAGVGPDQEVTPYYDPLIAKLVAAAGTRAEALERARAALLAFEIEGLTNNAAFLAEVLATPEVRAGEFDTGWLERYVKQSRGTP
jgi:acetyl-CoA carboxylase biotin carboxylase subunit